MQRKSWRAHSARRYAVSTMGERRSCPGDDPGRAETDAGGSPERVPGTETCSSDVPVPAPAPAPVPAPVPAPAPARSLAATAAFPRGSTTRGSTPAPPPPPLSPPEPPSPPPPPVKVVFFFPFPLALCAASRVGGVHTRNVFPARGLASSSTTTHDSEAEEDVLSGRPPRVVVPPPDLGDRFGSSSPPATLRRVPASASACSRGLAMVAELTTKVGSAPYASRQTRRSRLTTSATCDPNAPR